VREAYYFFFPPDKNMSAQDTHTFEIMKSTLKKKANTVDVGAHVGFITKHSLALAPEGEHFCFEPIPKYYQYLTKKFKNKNVHVYNMALGSKSETKEFHYLKKKPEESGFSLRGHDPDLSGDAKIQVKVDALDNVLPEHTRVDFIKIDVEGAEMAVLLGAYRTIRKNKPIIVFEHHKKSKIYFSDNSSDTIYDFLVEKCNLNVSSLNDYLQAKKYFSKKEFFNSVDSGKYYFIAFP
jgi:FkbM family methyltransferase